MRWLVQAPPIKLRDAMEWNRKLVFEADLHDGICFRVRGQFWTSGTELEVTDHGMAAFRRGLGDRRKVMLSLPWDQVRELHYAPAIAGAREGLYAREAEWCSRCLIPGLDEGQTAAIIVAVSLRFPHLAPSVVDGALEPATIAPKVPAGWPSFGQHRPAARTAH